MTISKIKSCVLLTHNNMFKKSDEVREYKHFKQPEKICKTITVSVFVLFLWQRKCFLDFFFKFFSGFFLKNVYGWFGFISKKF